MSARSKATAILLSLFTGPIGLHKFYLGRPIFGMVYIGSYIVGFATIQETPIIIFPVLMNIIDLVYLIVISQETFDRRYNGVMHAKPVGLSVSPGQVAIPGVPGGGVVINVSGNSQTNSMRQ